MIIELFIFIFQKEAEKLCYLFAGNKSSFYFSNILQEVNNYKQTQVLTFQPVGKMYFDCTENMAGSDTDYDFQ